MKGKKTIWIEQVTLNLLRIGSGLLFWQHGAQKLLGFPGGEKTGGFFETMGLSEILEVLGMAGGALLVFGVFTRPVALLLAALMGWAYFQVHAPTGWWPILNGGEMPAFYAFLFLYFGARGGGIFSVDGLRQLRRETKPKAVAAGEKTPAALPPDDDFPELTEEDLAEDPEIAELLGDNP
jgi:putative oxidoreductase